MLNITITDTSHSIFLQCKGHAGADDYGKDIVCASASILTFTLLEIVSRETDMADIHISPGDVEIDIPKARTTKKLLSALDTIAVGYRLLADDYPDYVSYKRQKK